MNGLPAVPRWNHHGSGWIPSKAECQQINAACNHFFAARGLTFLSFADRIRLEAAENTLPCAESTSREAGRRSPDSSSVDAHSSAHGSLSVPECKPGANKQDQCASRLAQSRFESVRSDN
jgi:hypothetical protein